jgi:DNA (cytosine-5)-methyltransferase 1
LATYTDVDKHGIEAAGSGEPPNNCPICLAVEQRDSEACDRNLRTGVAYRGVNYHVYDFALIRANDGPCQVGHITDIRFPQGSLSPNVIVKLLGRVNNLSGLLPPNVIKDEV